MSPDVTAIRSRTLPPTTTSPKDISPMDAYLLRFGGNAPIVLDLRLSEDRETLPLTLPGASTVAHIDLDRQLALCKDRPAILFCHRGLKLTHGAAARLSDHGVTVFRLAGGILAWQEADLPLIDVGTPPHRVVVPTHAELSQLPQIWTALRFSTPEAEVIDVAPDHVAEVARTFDAVDATQVTVPKIPHWQDLVSLTGTAALATQFDGLGRNPKAALPLVDALYRGLLQ
jgi:rhodanese-related sulfurtransferase